MTLTPSGATVRREIQLAADPAAVWDAIADFAAYVGDMMDQALPIMRGMLEG